VKEKKSSPCARRAESPATDPGAGSGIVRGQDECSRGESDSDHDCYPGDSASEPYGTAAVSGAQGA
jgi:hypothetical protein